MSVILQLESKIWSQGYPTGIIWLGVTNSGNEGASNIRLKVTDSVVFTSIDAFASSSWRSCLNTFAGYLNCGAVGAGQTKDAQFRIVIKGNAPVQVHNIPCDFQYTAY